MKSFSPTAGVPGSDAVALVSGAPVQIILLHMQFPLFSALIDLKEVGVVGCDRQF